VVIQYVSGTSQLKGAVHKNRIGIKLVANNDGADMLEQAGVAAE